MEIRFRKPILKSFVCFSNFVHLLSFTVQMLEKQLSSTSHAGPSSSVRFWEGALSLQVEGKRGT